MCMSSTVLMVAAEAREFQGLLSRVPACTLHWGLQFARETELNGNRVILIADGPGMRIAGVAADVARRHVRPDRVVSTGFCGAVDPELKAGDVLVASTVMDKELGREYECAADSWPSCQRGRVVSQNRVATTPGDKREIRSTGARAVEMEAGAVAGRARIWDVPFYCIRSVSDTAGENLEIDLNRMRDGDGRFSRGRIALAALARPWARIPALVRLDSTCRKASRSLGDFLANCRF